MLLIAIAFFVGSTVGFFVGVFTGAQRLPERAPERPQPNFDSEFWKRKRLHLTRTTTKH